MSLKGVLDVWMSGCLDVWWCLRGQNPDFVLEVRPTDQLVRQEIEKTTVVLTDSHSIYTIAGFHLFILFDQQGREKNNLFS